MSPPPKVINPAIMASRATAPRISNQRGKIFSVARDEKPV
jgi:hypothetical protein